MSYISIQKVKEGLWHPKTWFCAYVGGECIGRYKTKKEATQKAFVGAQEREEALKRLGEEIEQEFFE